MTERVYCAGGIVLDDAGRLLVIERGHPPATGRWSIPGGHCQVAESSSAACVREVAEETGLQVAIVRPAGRVARPTPFGDTYVIDDFLCTVRGGTLHAGDDARDVRWVTRAEFADLPLIAGLWDALAGWNLLPS